MYEKAIFLSRLEFAARLMAGGVEHIPCFPLPDAKEVDEGQMIEAVYRLIQEQYVQIGENGACLASELKPVVDDIRDSNRCLFMEPGDPSAPQRICYLGTHAAVLEFVGESEREFRLFSLAKEEFWEWLGEALDITLSEIMTKEETDRQIQMSELSVEEKEQLSACGYPGGPGPIGRWMELLEDQMKQTDRGGGGHPCMGIRLFDKKEGRNCCDLLLYQGWMNIWFIWCTPGKDIISAKENVVEVQAASLELKERFLKLFWEGKE